MTTHKPDIILLFSTRLLRLFAYGFLSVVLVLYLVQDGLPDQQIGLLLSLTLLGDAGVSLWITTSADRIGRRKMLVLGSLLMVLAGIVFILTRNVFLLIAAAILGVLSPSGNEIGPFLSIEQASLTQLVPDRRRTQVFAWYGMLGSFATALGALIGGGLAHGLQARGLTPLVSYQVILMGYAAGGLLLACLFLCLSPAVEVPRNLSAMKSSQLDSFRGAEPHAGSSPSSPQDQPPRRFLGLYKSRQVVFKLSVLFSLDAFAGALIVQSMVAYWFNLKYGTDVAVLGMIFFGANILAGLSALFAARLAAKFGLINTMVFTHLPSDVMLIMVPLMPTFLSTIFVLLVRFSLSQMDVPTRQSYTMAVVAPDERSAASGVTTIARSLGAALSPSLSGLFLTIPILFGAPFYLAGGLKIVYDVLLYRSFKALKPPEET